MSTGYAYPDILIRTYYTALMSFLFRIPMHEPYLVGNLTQRTPVIFWCSNKYICWFSGHRFVCVRRMHRCVTSFMHGGSFLFLYFIEILIVISHKIHKNAPTYWCTRQWLISFHIFARWLTHQLTREMDIQHCMRGRFGHGGATWLGYYTVGWRELPWRSTCHR